MSFTWPLMLIGLWLVPLLGLWYVLHRRRARQMIGRHGQFGADALRVSSSAHAQRWQPWMLLLLGVSGLSVAMARPQAPISVPRYEGTLILAFDVSGSMAADDLKPTRMEAAKAAAREFVEARPTGVRIGVVAFSDSGYAVQPPGYDREAILSAIDRLTPQRGTSLGNAILVSLDTIAAEVAPDGEFYSALTPAPTEAPTPFPEGRYSSASIVLLSDGENTGRPDPLLAASEASDRGVRIYAVGLGTAEGANLKVEGITVRTRLDAVALRQLADVTGGQYFDATAEAALRQVFDSLKLELVVREEKTEITAFVAAASLLVLLAGAAISILRSGRVA